MGVFFESPAFAESAVKGALREAIATDPKGVEDLGQEATRRVNELETHGGGFKPANLIAAIIVLIMFVGAAVWTDVANHDNSSTALWGFATTIFGVIVGLLGGERSSSS